MFSSVLFMFQRLRATALGTCDKNRTSNGAGDVVYVLLKSLTALGLQALFFEAPKIEACYQIVRARRYKKMNANEHAIFFR